MKTLYLVRHAEAIKRDSDLPDFERSLVRRGEKDAVRIARQLKKGKINPGVMISSPANRAIETAHIFAEALALPVETVLLKQEIYDATDGSSLLPVISSLADEHDTAMIFGHDPALSLLTGQFLLHLFGRPHAAQS